MFYSERASTGVTPGERSRELKLGSGSGLGFQSFANPVTRVRP